MKRITVLLFLILLFSVMSTKANVETNLYRTPHDGVERLTNLYVPEGEIDAILIVLHPLYSSGLAMEAITGLNEIGDERGWAIAYANAYYPYWDDGRIDAGLLPALGHADDSGFIQSLAASLSEDLGVDTVYLVGMGNGATMAMRVACEYGGQFDGLVAVSVLMIDYQTSDCDTATNILFIYGNRDFIFREEGLTLTINQAGDTVDIRSVNDTLAFWLEHNNCNTENLMKVQYSSLAIYNDCAENTITAFYTIPNGAGNWARMAENDLNRLGIDASNILAAFLDGDEDWYELTVQETVPQIIARNYILYVPQSYDPVTPTPVVLALHGRGTSMVHQARASGFNEIAEREGFIVLYPQGFDPYVDDPVWNYLRDTNIVSVQGLDDDLFLDMLVDDLAKNLNVDMNRLYVTGLSNGGYMTNRLACTRSERYAAFAPVAGAAPYGLPQLCAGTSHSPYMLVQGTADSISPWTGIKEIHPLTGQLVYTVAPVDITMDFWSDQNECTGSLEQENLPNEDPDSFVIIVSITDCPDDTAVQLYMVVDGGHVWPGVFDFESEQLGEVNMDYNVSEKIWEFFSQFTLEGRTEQ